jgi:hypothetical protein
MWCVIGVPPDMRGHVGRTLPTPCGTADLHRREESGGSDTPE